MSRAASGERTDLIHAATTIASAKVVPASSPPSATQDEDRPPATRFRLFLELTIAAILVIGSVRLVTLQRETTTLQRQLDTAKDSLAFARDYSAVIAEVLDLQIELNARKTGVIPVGVGPIRLPPPNSSIPRAQVRPVPSYLSSGPSEGERRLAEQGLALATPSETHGIRVIYHQADVSSSGAVRRMQTLGFSTVEASQLLSEPSTSITVGPQVNNSEIRLVGLSLIASGIDLKRIRRTSDQALVGAVEIGYTRSVLDWPSLDVRELERLTP